MADNATTACGTDLDCATALGPDWLCCDYYAPGVLWDREMTLHRVRRWNYPLDQGGGGVPSTDDRAGYTAVRWPLVCRRGTACRRRWCQCDEDCSGESAGQTCCEGRCTAFPEDLPVTTCTAHADCRVAPLIRCCGGRCTDAIYGSACPPECESEDGRGCLSAEAEEYVTRVLPRCWNRTMAYQETRFRRHFCQVTPSGPGWPTTTPPTDVPLAGAQTGSADRPTTTTTTLWLLLSMMMMMTTM